jgi:hypothetical protein
VGIEQRRHPRFDVRLAVRYSNATEFVNDYVENLSQGGLFIAGAKLEMGAVSEVKIDLPGQGQWTVRAKVMFVLDAAAAGKAGRRPGVGFEILDRPPGFEDALLGYLLRLGRRRDHTVMIDEDSGASYVKEAGYLVKPLVAPEALSEALADPTLIAVVVPATVHAAYRDRGGTVLAMSGRRDLADLLARLDSLL